MKDSPALAHLTTEQVSQPLQVLREAPLLFALEANIH